MDGSKRVRCKRGQVRVRVVGRTTCRPLRKAVPTPSSGDPRLAFLDAALTPRVQGLRDRRGRRLLTPAKLGGRPGAAARRGIRVLRRVTPKVLARLDALGERGRASALARASADCSGGPSIRSNESFGGADVSLTLGKSAGATMGVAVGGYRIVAKFDLASPCDRLDVPACPTADGVLEGSDTKRFIASVTVLHGSDVVSSTSVEMANRMKLRGQVADDAKLDTLDITDHAEYSVRTQAVTIKATIKRTALQIDMRTGDFKPSRASVDVQLFTHGGVDQSSSAKSEQANSLADDYDKSFSKIVSQEIATYRSLEKAWQTAGACAKLAFDRPSGDLQPLSKGQTGQVTGHVVANSDSGTARSARWSVVDANNGTFTPSSATGALPVFSWTVTKTGEGIKLKGDFKATSTAGVASGTWEQETEDKPLYRGTISGTRGETFIPGECGGGWQFNYSARLADIVGSDQPFAIVEPVNGGTAEIGGARGYDETGNGTYTLAPCHGLPGCSSNLWLDPASSHGVALFTAVADIVGVTVDVAPILHGHNCGFPGLTLGEGTFPRSMVGADTITVELSFNSGPVFGNGTMTLTRVN